VKRREFITLLGGGATVACPLAARSQQAAVPVIGFLDPRSPDTMAGRLRAFRQGLRDSGFVEGENLAIEYRWAEGQYDRLPALAAELDRRKVAVIVASGGRAPVLAAIPIVFLTVEDPVKVGLVASLARPEGNLTGVTILQAELAPKRLELLRVLVPGAVRVAVLINPNNPAADITLKELDAAARATGLQVQVLNASTSREIDAAFATIARERLDALFVSPAAFFTSRRMQLTHLASHHAVPASYSLRNYVEAGGLMSYGANLRDMYRQIGIYVGRILKGAKPADLPVVQSSRFELVINAQIARMLGLTVPEKLLVAADELIE
jgi:putative ABC transport system substrate-binding protein